MFFKQCSSSLFCLYWKQFESESSHTLWIWCEGKWIYTLTQELNPQIGKMTQASEWVQEDKTFPLLSLQGIVELTQTFPLSLFSLPMSSVWTKPGVHASPQDQRPLQWGDKTPPKALDFIRQEAGFRCAPASWGGQTWAHVTSLLLLLLLQSCLVNTSPLHINALCRWPVDLCLVPGFTSIVLGWWCWGFGGQRRILRSQWRKIAVTSN